MADVQDGATKLNCTIFLLMARGYGQDKSEHQDEEIGECFHGGSYLSTVDGLAEFDRSDERVDVFKDRFGLDVMEA